MIRSMTGFGSASTTAAGVTLGLELRSVNSRHLKLHFRMPPGTERWEESLRETISAQVRRGHVDVALRIGPSTQEGGSSPGEGFRLDEARVQAYVDGLRELKERWDLPGEVDIGLVGRCERLLVEATTDPLEAVPLEVVTTIADAAVTQLVEMRLREGQRLALDLMNLAGDIEVDPDRLAREIAFIADKWDISEEVVRTRAHLEAFRELVDASEAEPVGKRLGFLGQELLREVNTIGSKANDATIGRIVVEMKNELESLREQNENVE